MKKVSLILVLCLVLGLGVSQLSATHYGSCTTPCDGLACEIAGSSHGTCCTGSGTFYAYATGDSIFGGPCPVKICYSSNP